MKPKITINNLNVSITKGEAIEIEGTLIPYNTGRSEEYEFNTSYFLNKESEEYYNDNWEVLEQEVLKLFSSCAQN